MSREPMYSRLSHPHARIPGFDPEARAANLRRPRRPSAKLEERRKLEIGTMGSGFFIVKQPAEPEQQLNTSGVAAHPHIESAREKPRLPLRYKKGTYIYEVRLNPKTGAIIIPSAYAPEMEESLFVEELLFDQYFDTDPSCVGLGERGKLIRKTIGKSDLGAFTIALCPAMGEDGQEIMVQRLISFTQRRLKKENEKVRFKQATSRI